MSKVQYFNCKKKKKQPTLYQESQSKLEYFCNHFLFIGYEFFFFFFANFSTVQKPKNKNNK